MIREKHRKINNFFSTNWIKKHNDDETRKYKLNSLTGLDLCEDYHQVLLITLLKDFIIINA